MAYSEDHHVDTPNSPSRSMAMVVPHDQNPLPVVPKALYVGTAGHVTVRCIDDMADVTFRNVPAGGLIRARVRYVRASGTTAADILAHL